MAGDLMDLKLLYEAKSGNIDSRNQFIEANKHHIHRYACLVCKRYLSWQNDDELSIALLAFNNSIDSFEKGDFEAYSKMVMKSRLIDYFRKNNRNDIPIEDEALTNSLQYESNTDEKLDRAAQIGIFKELLFEFKIDMADLLKRSPKHSDTRKRLLDIAFQAASTKKITDSLMTQKLLPIKEIMCVSDVSRKLLEEWRKYLIALIIIFYDKRLESIKDFIV